MKCVVDVSLVNLVTNRTINVLRCEGDASLERWLPQLRSWDYSYLCITQFGFCIKQKERKNSEVSVGIVPTCYQQVTDMLLTHLQLLANCWPTGSLCLGQNLSVDCRPTVGRLLANRRLTVGQEMADSWPTVGRQIFRGALLHNYLIFFILLWSSFLPAICRELAFLPLLSSGNHFLNVHLLNPSLSCLHVHL